MADRSTFTSGSTPPVGGGAVLDNLSAHVGRLYDSSILTLTSIGGTANAITATVDPTLDSGLVTGMGFWLTPTADNTGAVTLKINTEAALAVLSQDGSALIADDLLNGQTYLVLYDGSAFRAYGIGGGSAGGVFDFQQFTTSGTWTKPVNIDPNAAVLVELWGAGGGGASVGGGGGGGYVARIFRASDLGSTESVSVGAGGAGTGGTPGTAGGNTTFGSLLTAFGGGGGTNTDGGKGGKPWTAGASSGGIGADPDTIWHGGDGTGSSGAGGPSVFGGAGGSGTGTGGTSVFGGDGGADAVVGTAPGGGGGETANGARGECRVTVL